MNSLTISHRPGFLMLTIALLVSGVLWLGVWSSSSDAVFTLAKTNFDFSRQFGQTSAITMVIGILWCAIAAWAIVKVVHVPPRLLAVSSVAVVAWVGAITVAMAFGHDFILELQLGRSPSAIALWLIAIALWTVEIAGAILLIRLVVKHVPFVGWEFWMWLSYTAFTCSLAARVLFLLVTPGVTIRGIGS